jgi:hypothetical protein
MSPEGESWQRIGRRVSCGVLMPLLAFFSVARKKTAGFDKNQYPARTAGLPLARGDRKILQERLAAHI